MSDKKNIFSAIFLMVVVFLFIIPISAFITLEILGVDAAQSMWRLAYKILMEQGALIAGVMAIIGVAWMVYAQRVETAKTIASNQEAQERNSFELKKIRAIDDFFLLEEQFENTRKILLESKPYLEDFQSPIKKAIQKPSRYVRYFLGDDCSLTLLHVDAVESYFRYVFQGRSRSSEKWLLHILGILYENPIYMYSREEWRISTLCGLENPKDIIKNRDEISSDVTLEYILDYMEHIVMRDFERIIKESSFKK